MMIQQALCVYSDTKPNFPRQHSSKMQIEPYTAALYLYWEPLSLVEVTVERVCDTVHWPEGLHCCGQAVQETVA